MVVFRKIRRRLKPRLLTPAEKRWQKEARAMIIERTSYWARRMGVQPKRIAIRDQRSRWGSASSLGNINLSWRISLMPEPIMDYIIIHELAHLKEMNHSAKYWRVVAGYCPDYREHRQWLREHGGRFHRRVV